MQVVCPECGATVSASPGADMVCPACMAAFVAPYLGAAASEDSAPGGAVRWDVEAGPEDGAVAWAAVSRHKVRAALYAGALGAGARVRPAGAAGADDWVLVGSVRDFSVVLGLRGGDLAPLAGARRLARVANGGGGRRRDWEAAGLAAPAVTDEPRPVAGSEGAETRRQEGAATERTATRLGGGGSEGGRRAAVAVPTLRGPAPPGRVHARTVLLVALGALAVAMAAWLGSA